MTKNEAAIISAYTGYMVGNFGDMQEYAERTLGRSIFTHQFANEHLVAELKAAAHKDLLKIVVEG